MDICWGGFVLKWLSAAAALLWCGFEHEKMHLGNLDLRKFSFCIWLTHLWWGMLGLFICVLGTILVYICLQQEAGRRLERKLCNNRLPIWPQILGWAWAGWLHVWGAWVTALVAVWGHDPIWLLWGQSVFYLVEQPGRGVVHTLLHFIFDWLRCLARSRGLFWEAWLLWSNIQYHRQNKVRQKSQSR